MRFLYLQARWVKKSKWKSMQAVFGRFSLSWFSPFSKLSPPGKQHGYLRSVWQLKIIWNTLEKQALWFLDRFVAHLINLREVFKTKFTKCFFFTNWSIFNGPIMAKLQICMICFCLWGYICWGFSEGSHQNLKPREIIQIGGGAFPDTKTGKKGFPDFEGGVNNFILRFPIFWFIFKKGGNDWILLNCSWSVHP